MRSVPPPVTSEASSRTQSSLDYGIRTTDLVRLQTLTPQGILKVVPLRDTEQKVVRGDMRIGANAIATVPGIFEIISLELERGRYFTDLDNDFENPKPVCVLGALAAQQIFPYEDPLGEAITVG